jgi:uncharacterized protein (DUF4415 family)
LKLISLDPKCRECDKSHPAAALRQSAARAPASGDEDPPQFRPATARAQKCSNGKGQDSPQRFKKQADDTGRGYQTLINEALKAYLEKKEKPMAADVVRKIVREEIAASS